jgi:hypothetical protein
MRATAFSAFLEVFAEVVTPSDSLCEKSRFLLLNDGAGE